MQTIKVETVVGKGGTLTVTGLPFQDGEVVAVSISPQTTSQTSSSHPLAGLPITYIDPFEPVAVEDWEALQ